MNTKTINCTSLTELLQAKDGWLKSCLKRNDVKKPTAKNLVKMGWRIKESRDHFYQKVVSELFKKNRLISSFQIEISGTFKITITSFDL